jgi:predicted nucleotidyltransferase
MKGIKASIRSNKYLKWLLILSNFMNSGLRGSDKTERFLKFLRILFFFTMYFVLISNLFKYSLVFSLCISFFLGYFSNWLFHFNKGTLKIHYLGLGDQKKENFFEFMKLINKLASNFPRGVLLIAGFGSASRGKLHYRSDLDVTVLRKKGFLNAIYAFYFIEKVRRLASKNLIAFDSAMGDSIEFIKKKYRADEPPIAIYDPCLVLDKYYKKKYSIEEAQKINK